MRRNIVLLFVVIAVIMTASTVCGQSFPAEMRGDQLVIDEVETIMVYAEAYNMPWSTPDPSGVIRAVIVESDFGTFQYTDLFLRRHYTMTWVEDCGCYAAWTFPAPDKIRYIAVTLAPVLPDGWVGVMREGQMSFTGHPPQFWDYDFGYPMLVTYFNTYIVPEVVKTDPPERADD